MESNITFVPTPTEKAVIVQALKTVSDVPGLQQKYALMVADKVKRGVSLLDGGELRVIAEALALKGKEFHKRGWKQAGRDLMVKGRECDRIRAEFHSKWEQQLLGVK